MQSRWKERIDDDCGTRGVSACKYHARRIIAMMLGGASSTERNEWALAAWRRAIALAVYGGPHS